MQRISSLIEARKAQVAAHPFFRWIMDGSAPLERRLEFAPVFVNFIMSFSDLNKWFLKYPEPANVYERSINKHTFEDRTHSRLFIEDWRKLGFDARLGWRASDALEWCYAAPETELIRDHGMELMKMCTLAGDPLVRFALMEAIEACGHVFLSATCPVATRLGNAWGTELRYFGEHHLRREIGHVQAGGDDFARTSLDEGQYRHARELANRFFDMFLAECDRLLEYGEAVVQASGEHRQRGERTSPDAGGARTVSLGRGLGGRPPTAPLGAAQGWPATSASGHARVAQVMEARKRAAEEHALFRWMETTGEHDAKGCLRHIALFWAPDILGYRDLVTYALAYRAPGDERQRAINGRLSLLQSHHRLFLRDWDELDMDHFLGWTASDTIDFYYRSRYTEVQRHSMSCFVKLACHHPDPLLRFWLIEALEASGEAFFRNTRALAQRVEARDGARLDYLADRHALAHPSLERDEQVAAVDFAREALDECSQEIAIRGIHTVFDCLDRQLTHSLEHATRDVPTAWRPPESTALQSLSV